MFKFYARSRSRISARDQTKDLDRRRSTSWRAPWRDSFHDASRSPGPSSPARRLLIGTLRGDLFRFYDNPGRGRAALKLRDCRRNRVTMPCGPLRYDDVVIGVSFKFAPPAGLKLRACQPGARPESQWRGRPARDRLRDSELRKARNLIEIEINLPDGSWPGFRVLPAPSHGPCDRFRAGVGLGKSEPESVPVDRDGSPSH